MSSNLRARVFPGVLAVVWAVALLWHYNRQAHNPARSFSEWAERIPAASLPKTPSRPELRPGDTDDNLFWFVHVSDLHLNHFGRGDGLENFAYLLEHTLPAVDPLFVVATGDLTDGKDQHGFGSRQHEEEWKSYRGMLQKAGIYDREDFWFDLPGNHDCFGVPGSASPENMFARYSRMKTAAYHHVFRLPFGNYGLIAVDGCPEYGPSRPFNFFGTLTSPKMDRLAEAVKELSSAKVRHTFVISHYPIVTMRFQASTRGVSFADLSTTFTAYLSGHLHRLIGGIGREIYARQSTGFLDLEVDDVKESRALRVMAVDHDIVSFVDVPIDQQPIILVTNPADARFHVPLHEDLTTASRSLHIRVLLFAPSPIVECYAVIEGTNFVLERARTGKSPLWTAAWSPAQFPRGLYTIKVFARDSAGNANTVQHHFSLDGTEAPIGSVGEGLALLRLEVWTRRLFWSVFSLVLFGLVLIPRAVIGLKKSQCSLRAWSHEMIESLRMERARLDQSSLASFLVRAPQWVVRSTIFRVCKLYQCSTVFWLILLHTLYIPVGPIFIGRLGNTDQSVSFFFATGIWQPGSGWALPLDTWTFTTLILCIQVLPAILVLSVFSTSHDLYSTTIRLGTPQAERTILPLACRPYHRRPWFRVLVCAWWLICLYETTIVALRYGLLTVLLGFGLAWHFLTVSVLLGRALWSEDQPFEALNKEK